MEEDGAARRSVLTRWGGGQSVTSLQTPIKLSAQPAERTPSLEWGLSFFDKTEDALDSGHTGRETMEAKLAVTFGTVWPRCEFIENIFFWSDSSSFFRCCFLRQNSGDGASTQRAEPSSQTGPPRTHQLRHRPDPGCRYGARKRAHGWKTERIGFKQRGRLLQFGEPDRGQCAFVHRAVDLPLRYNASGRGAGFIRGEQESGEPGSDSSPGPQTRDGPGTPGARPERRSWIWRAVLPLDREQVRQGQNIR